MDSLLPTFESYIKRRGNSWIFGRHNPFTDNKYNGIEPSKGAYAPEQWIPEAMEKGFSAPEKWSMRKQKKTRDAGFDNTAMPDNMVNIANSSNIGAVGYDDKNKTMAISFKGGGDYKYAEVEPDTVAKIISGVGGNKPASVGSAFWRWARNPTSTLFTTGEHGLTNNPDAPAYNRVN